MTVITLKDSYGLMRSSDEAKRLEAQGNAWTSTIGYLLHPHISSRLPPDPKIADVGCGTGGFLTSLSDQLSCTSTLIGFDISSKQFRNSLPENVKLLVADARNRFPLEHHGTFDAVHLRLLVAGLEKNDWDLVTHNVAQLLKPKGAIQWEEANLPAMRGLRSRPGCSAEVLDMALRTLADTMKTRYMYGYSTLPGTFKQAGLCDISQDVVASDCLPEARRAFAETSMRACLDWARFMANERAMPIWSDHQLLKMERRMNEEIENGAYARYDIYVTIGWKL